MALLSGIPGNGSLIYVMATISRQKLAERIDVSTSQLSRIISGETKTVISDILIGIANMFKISTD